MFNSINIIKFFRVLDEKMEETGEEVRSPTIRFIIQLYKIT